MGVTFGKAYIEQYKKENQGTVDAKKNEIAQMKQMAAQIESCKTGQLVQFTTQMAGMGIQLGTLLASNRAEGGRGGSAATVESPKAQQKQIFDKYGVTDIQGLEQLAESKKNEINEIEANITCTKTNIEGLESDIKTISDSFNGHLEQLAQLQGNLDELTKSDPNSPEIPALKSQIEQLEQQIQQEEQQLKEKQAAVKELTDGDNASSLKSLNAKIEPLRKEYGQIASDLQQAKALEAKIKKEEGNVEGKTKEVKSQNESRNEFVATIQGQDLDNPTEDTFKAAQKWLDENTEVPSDPSQKAAYNICKAKAEKISENYKKNHKNADDTANEPKSVVIRDDAPATPDWLKTRPFGV